MIKNDFGIMVSQEGFDVKNCPDNKLLMSTKHRLINILKEGWDSFDVIVHSKTAFDISDVESDVKIDHNLGFNPMYFAFVQNQDGQFKMINYSSMTKESLILSLYEAIPDDLEDGIFDPPLIFTVRYYYIIFDVDLDEEFNDYSADIYVPRPDISGRKFGIITSESGSSVNNVADNKIGITSSGQTLALHKLAQMEEYGSAVHGLPYVPEVYIYALTDVGTFSLLPSNYYTINKNSIDVKENVFYLKKIFVVLKDSLEI